MPVRPVAKTFCEMAGTGKGDTLNLYVAVLSRTNKPVLRSRSALFGRGIVDAGSKHGGLPMRYRESGTVPGQETEVSAV